MSQFHLLQTVLTFCLCISIVSAAKQCYYPGAILQTRDTPCHPNAKQSNCCAPEDICLSNGLCYRSNINRLHRGSCTDPTFKHPSCTSICTGPNDSPYGWADVLECPLSQQWYCGWGNQSRCESGDTFTLRDGYFDDHRQKSHQGQATVTVTEGGASCTQAVTAGSQGSNAGMNVSMTATPVAATTAQPFTGQAEKVAMSAGLFLSTLVIGMSTTAF